MNYKLAIVIPFFKINFFKETVESLAQQTDQRFQVYIGDDASPVPPTELLEKYQGKFNVTYKRFKDNLGSISLVKQWERCIALMQNEEWFMILGDDDVLGENVVEKFYQNLSEIEQNSNVVRFSSIVINEKDEKISEYYFHPKLENTIESYCRKLDGVTRSSLSEYIFKKRSYNKYGFKNYDLAWSSDDRAVIDFSEKKLIFSINNALVHVRISHQNISGKKDNLKFKINATNQFNYEILRDYFNILTCWQKKKLFLNFEYNFFKSKNYTFWKVFFIFLWSFQIFGFNYGVNQLKSLLYLLINKKSNFNNDTI